MPLIYVQSYRQVAITGVGTQYILAGGVLTINGYAEITLDPASFGAAGTYVLYDWSAAGASSTVTQADLNTYVIAQFPAYYTTYSVANSGIPQLDTVNKRITITVI